MELPQKRGQTSRPLSCIVLSIAMVFGMATTTIASGTIESSNGVATAQSFTYFSDVPDWAQSSVARGINNDFIRGTGTTEGVIRLDLSEDFTRTIVILDRAGLLGDASDAISEDWFLPEPVEVTPETSQEDRTSPIYEVYKNGYYVDVPAEIQWTIHDLLVKYNYKHLEPIIFGLALKESTFDPSCSSGGCLGLYQIQTYWIKGANITHFTDDYRNRSLYDSHDATLTLLEMMQYAIDSYGIDITSEQGIKDWLYWHNTGQYKKNVNWGYSNDIFAFANELITLQ